MKPLFTKTPFQPVTGSGTSAERLRRKTGLTRSNDGMNCLELGAGVEGGSAFTIPKIYSVRLGGRFEERRLVVCFKAFKVVRESRAETRINFISRSPEGVTARRWIGVYLENRIVCCKPLENDEIGPQNKPDGIGSNVMSACQPVDARRLRSPRLYSDRRVLVIQTGKRGFRRGIKTSSH